MSKNYCLQALRSGDVRFVAEGVAYIILLSYVFYENIFMALFLCPYVFFYTKSRKREKEEKDKFILTEKFKDAMQAVAFSLNVGYSIENAFAEAHKEMMVMYGEGDEIVTLFRNIVNRINRNENLEDVLLDIGNQVGIEDVIYFAEIFKYAKRSGGDLNSIIRNTTRIIKEKSDVSREINTIISGKKLEQRVMKFIPLGIVLYLKICSRDFIEPLFGNLLGVCIMTVCLVVCFIADALAKRIIKIEI